MKIKYNVYEMIGRLYQINSEINEQYEDAYSSNEIMGCECGCGGDSAMDYITDLENERNDIIEMLTDLGVEIEDTTDDEDD